jgi:hypothetical protein
MLGASNLEDRAVEEIDPEQARVMALLAPHLRRFFPIFGAAVDLYNSDVSNRARAIHSGSAIAHVVNDHVWAGLEAEFADEPDFHFLNVRNLKLLSIRDELLIRAKKVDENGRHQNADTAQQRAFDAQQDIPGLPPAATRLVIGYQPDEAFSEVVRVTVRRPLSRWVAQIVETEDECSWEDITPVELPFRRRANG